MEKVTISEVYRILTDHMSKEEDFRERFENKLDAILLQTTKTNGRLLQVEQWRKDEVNPVIEEFKQTRTEVKFVGKMWTIFWGALTALIGLLIGFKTLTK